MIATEGLGSQSSKRLCKNGSGTSPPSRRSMLHHRADTFNCAGCCLFTITGRQLIFDQKCSLHILTSGCNLSAGPLFVCNVEGCKRKFKEEPALYAHARVHGDRAYACHYEGCNKVLSLSLTLLFLFSQSS
jgi:hypothetical protein